MDHVKKAIAAQGGTSKVAKRSGCTPQCVSNWIARGNIPLKALYANKWLRMALNKAERSDQ